MGEEVPQLADESKVDKRRLADRARRAYAQVCAGGIRADDTAAGLGVLPTFEPWTT